jgi:hypothetical protein
MMTAATQTEILETLRNLTADRDYVSLTTLRIELDHIARAELDATLTSLILAGRIALIRNDNPAELSRRDHEAALDLNGSPRHLVRIV